MNKTKIKNFALLFMAFLFLVTLTFSFLTMRRVGAEDAAIDDVNMALGSAGGDGSTGTLSKTQDNTIYGEENVTAYGWTGWGGGAWRVDFDQSYDVSAVANSGKGALSFWLYIPDESVLKKYSELTADWEMEITSNDPSSWSDSTKCVFAVPKTVFENARVGWQRLLLPIADTENIVKGGIDWTSITGFRLNVNNRGINSGYTGKLAKFSFTTTNLPKFAITGDPVVTFGHGTVSGVDTETMTIPDLGQDFTAYYNKDKGGFLTVLELNQVYSVNKTTDSALSVWVYFDRDTDKTALNAYNIDISSGNPDDAYKYSDQHKYCFNIKSLFSKCKTGWNQLILPLESANEKPAGMDWSNVRWIRLNVDGGTPCRVAMANMQIIHSGVTEPTVVGYVEPTEQEPDLTQTLTTDGGIVAFSNLAGFTAIDTISQLDENTTAQYVFANSNGTWSTFGGMVRATVLDRPYNVSAISSNAKGAFTFWLYIHTQKTLDKMRSGTPFNLNLSSGKEFSDTKKWEYNIASLAGDMMIGWNKIIIPFSSSMCAKPGGGAENATVENIRFVALDGAGAGDADVAFADFGFFLTDETQPCVVNQKTLMTRPDDVTFGVGNAADFTADTALLTDETAYSAIGRNWGVKAQTITLDRAYDLSNHNLYGKSVLSFMLYFEDETTLEAHRAIESGYVIRLGSGDAFAESNSYAFDISALFADCSVGWNKFNLPVETADNKGEIDWANVKFVQVGWNTAFGEGECEVAFAQFSLISTDETARSVENDTAISLGVRSIAEFDKQNIVRNKKSIASYSLINKGYGRFDEEQVTLAKAYDASKFEQKGALAFWLYIEDEATLNAYKGIESNNVTGGWTVTLYSGSYHSANKLTFEISSLFDECITGWNYLVLPFAVGTNANLDFSNIAALGIRCKGTTDANGQNEQNECESVVPGKNNIALAQFSVIATEATDLTVTEKISNAETGLNPIKEKVIIDCNRVDGDNFLGNNVDRNDYRYGTGAVYTSGAGYQLNARFEAGETDLRKNTLILAFWLWIEDPAYYFEDGTTNIKQGLNGQVELSSSSQYDVEEIKWEVSEWGVDKFEKGWNWVVLKGVDGAFTGGSPNFDALTRFRIYVNNIQASAFKIDRITIGSDEKLLTAPDWESEIVGGEGGGFKGDNAFNSTNSTYIEVDFDSAKEFTGKVTETVTRTVEGCNSSLFAAPVCLVVIAGALAVTLVFVLKKKEK